jgi:hypothetical protein
MRIKAIFTAVLAGVAAVAVGAGAASAISTYRTGGVTDEQAISTSSDPFLVPGPNTWQTVPSTAITVVVPRGERRILTARFNAESLCVAPNGWCSARVVYTSGGPLSELSPDAATDYAFDSDGDLWSAHSMDRSSAQYLRSGVYRVMVQAQRVNATQFRLDDYHFTVGLIAP